MARFTITISAVLALVLALPGTALAAGPMAPGTVGSDVSWPQCGQEWPAGYSYAMVGVTGGRPFSANQCFTAQFNWSHTIGQPQLYLNLEYGEAPAAGPLHCAAGDWGCGAYNFGWSAAADAYARAANATGGASAGVSTWWLDVETENAWNDDNLAANTYVIQGALDYLQRIQGRTAGIYSTPYQWALIAGDFAPANTPNWVAGADNLDDYAKCQTPLWPGAQVWVVQYLNLDLDLDQNRACWVPSA